MGMIVYATAAGRFERTEAPERRRCFWISPDGTFCGHSPEWHRPVRTWSVDHSYVSLLEMILEVTELARWQEFRRMKALLGEWDR